MSGSSLHTIVLAETTLNSKLKDTFYCSLLTRYSSLHKRRCATHSIHNQLHGHRVYLYSSRLCIQHHQPVSPSYVMGLRGALDCKEGGKLHPVVLYMGLDIKSKKAYWKTTMRVWRFEVLEVGVGSYQTIEFYRSLSPPTLSGTSRVYGGPGYAAVRVS